MGQLKRITGMGQLKNGSIKKVHNGMGQLTYGSIEKDHWYGSIKVWVN